MTTKSHTSRKGRSGEFFYPGIPGLCGCVMALLLSAIISLAAYVLTTLRAT